MRESSRERVPGRVRQSHFGLIGSLHDLQIAYPIRTGHDVRIRRFPPPRKAPGACTHPLNFVMAGLLSRPPMKTLLPGRHEFPGPHWQAQVFMGRRDNSPAMTNQGKLGCVHALAAKRGGGKDSAKSVQLSEGKAGVHCRADVSRARPRLRARLCLACGVGNSQTSGCFLPRFAGEDITWTPTGP